MHNSLIPWTYKELEKRDYKKLPKVSTVALLLVACINIFVAIAAPEIVKIMAPVEYYKAVYVIPPIAISNMFMFMFNLYANIEYFFEETRMVSIASVSSAVLNILLNYVFITKFGFIAAGFTTAFCYCKW